jgi:hypothetical protein
MKTDLVALTHQIFFQVLVCIMSIMPASATTYNVVDDFSGALNPNGTYSYGYYYTDFSLLTQAYNGPPNYAAHYENSGPYISWTGVDNYWNGYYWPSNVLLFDPSYSGLYTVLRFTAPNTNTYSTFKI